MGVCISGGKHIVSEEACVSTSGPQGIRNRTLGLATTGSLTESLVGSRHYSHKSASAYRPGFLGIGPAFLGEVDHPWLESSIV